MPPQLDAALAANRDAVTELAATAARCDAMWTTPRAPGKWSPSQLVEHVARAMEASADEVVGRPSILPTVPALLRPLVRALARFDEACRAKASGDTVVSSGAFGRVSLVDYATFQALHTRHHCRQLTS